MRHYICRNINGMWKTAQFIRFRKIIYHIYFRNQNIILHCIVLRCFFTRKKKYLHQSNIHNINRIKKTLSTPKTVFLFIDVFLFLLLLLRRLFLQEKENASMQLGMQNKRVRHLTFVENHKNLLTSCKM